MVVVALSYTSREEQHVSMTFRLVAFHNMNKRREQLPLWRIRSQTDIIECDLIPPQVATLGSLIGSKL